MLQERRMREVEKGVWGGGSYIRPWVLPDAQMHVFAASEHQLADTQICAEVSG